MTNIADLFLDARVREGRGDRIAVRTADARLELRRDPGSWPTGSPTCWPPPGSSPSSG